jgi:diketogulonate reductase-like aldo/keto reductase
MINHLEELFSYANIIPALNQVEFSPYAYHKELLSFCTKNKILLEAYSPLTRMKKLGDPKLKGIATKYGKTTAQVLIRWAIDHDLVVIPKSARKERIIENADVFDFELDKDDMKILDNLNEDFRVSWDPTTAD